MKLKHLFIVSLILLSILTLSAVSASDNITYDAIPTEDNSTEPIANEEDISEEYGPIGVDFEENLEILPTPNQTIRIYGVEETTGNFTLSIDGKQNPRLQCLVRLTPQAGHPYYRM